jgi:opacity protein-like surface antigen
MKHTGKEPAPAQRIPVSHLLFVSLLFITVLYLTHYEISVARAGEVNIVAFGGLYDALAANAEVRDTPPSQNADNPSFNSGQIYGARFEWFSTKEFSNFFGVGLEVASWDRGFSMASSSGFRQTDVDASAVLLSFSFLLRRPTGQFRPYGGTGISFLIVDYDVVDTRNETTGQVTERSSLSNRIGGWHFLGGLKFFLPESLSPQSLPGRFFLMGEYRFLLAKVVTTGATFSNLNDLANGQFFIGGIGFQFRVPTI